MENTNVLLCCMSCVRRHVQLCIRFYSTCMHVGEPPASDIRISTPPQRPVVGLPYTPECVLTNSELLEDASVDIQWLNSRGEVLTMLSTTGNVSLPLDFTPISASDAGNYVCRAVITSPLLDGPQTIQTDFDLDPLRKFLHV